MEARVARLMGSRGQGVKGFGLRVFRASGALNPKLLEAGLRVFFFTGRACSHSGCQDLKK